MDPLAAGARRAARRRQLDFTVQRGGAIRFTGDFLDENRVQLTSIEGTITACRRNLNNDPPTSFCSQAERPRVARKGGA